MAKSRKRKPSFDGPADTAGPSDTTWVYRSESGAPAGRRPSKPAGPVVMDVPPAKSAAAAAGTRRTTHARAAADPPPRPALHAPAESDAASAGAREIGGHAIVERHALYAAAAGLLPVPLLDVAAIAGVQIAMARALARHYGVPFDRDKGRTIVTAIAGGVASTAAGRGVLKVLIKQIPVAGTVFSFATVSALASAVTYAVGCVFIAHFESGGTLDDLDVEQWRQQVARRLSAAPAPA